MLKHVLGSQQITLPLLGAPRAPGRRRRRSALRSAGCPRATGRSARTPLAHPPLGELASRGMAKVSDDLVAVEGEGGTPLGGANVDGAAGVGITQSLHSHLHPHFWAMRSLGAAQRTRRPPSSVPAGACTFCRQMRTFSGLSVFCFPVLRSWRLPRLCRASLGPRGTRCWAEGGWAGRRAAQTVFVLPTCHVKGF